MLCNESCNQLSFCRSSELGRQHRGVAARVINHIDRQRNKSGKISPSDSVERIDTRHLVCLPHLLTRQARSGSYHVQVWQVAMIDPPFGIAHSKAGVVVGDTPRSHHGSEALGPDRTGPTHLTVGANEERQIKVRDRRSVEYRSLDLFCLLFGDKAVSARSSPKPPRLALLLAVIAGEVMSLLVTAGMRDPLFHARDGACSRFVRNLNESD